MTGGADAPGAGSDLSLSTLRNGIDEIDDAVLALILRRQDLARRINELKPPAHEALKLRPDREAHVVGRLVERAAPADRRLVLALWREIMSAGLAVQTELTVIVASEVASIRHAARLRFGISARYRRAAPEEALRAAESETAVVVLDLADTAAWWTGLPDRRDLWIFDQLELEAGGSALVVGRVLPDSLAPGLTFQVRPQGDAPAGPGQQVLATAEGMALVQWAVAEPGSNLDRGSGFVGSAPNIG
ncbi:MAG: chorismate mutase [Proteobacteria bacterium]|nr:chorismate mutase [Pseudomonadota bacterium]